MGFEPATVDSRELYAPTERRVVKFGIYTHRAKLARQGVKPFLKRLHDQTWNRTPTASSKAVGIEPETVKQRTLCYNLKKGGEIWYIYPSNKGNWPRQGVKSFQKKGNCMTKPGIERLLFLAVAFEPTIVDNKNVMLQPKERW